MESTNHTLVSLIAEDVAVAEMFKLMFVAQNDNERKSHYLENREL